MNYDVEWDVDEITSEDKIRELLISSFISIFEISDLEICYLLKIKSLKNQVAPFT